MHCVFELCTCEGECNVIFIHCHSYLHWLHVWDARVQGDLGGKVQLSGLLTDIESCLHLQLQKHFEW